MGSEEQEVRRQIRRILEIDEESSESEEEDNEAIKRLFGKMSDTLTSVHGDIYQALHGDQGDLHKLQYQTIAYSISHTKKSTECLEALTDLKTALDNQR